MFWARRDKQGEPRLRLIFEFIGTPPVWLGAVPAGPLNSKRSSYSELEGILSPGARFVVVAVRPASEPGIDFVVTFVQEDLLSAASGSWPDALPGAVLGETADWVAGDRHGFTGDDGWVDCDCGEQHFGPFGAAGLFLMHRAEDGTLSVLMQLRSGANQHAGTWGLPGGARGYREPVASAAGREAWEETGIGPGQYRVLDPTHRDDHGNWAYTYVFAEADEQLTPTANAEGIELRWVPVDDALGLGLVPRLAEMWPTLTVRARLRGHDTTGTGFDAGVSDGHQ